MLERRLDWRKPVRRCAHALYRLVIAVLFGLGALVLWPYLVVAWLLEGEDEGVISLLGILAESLYALLLWLLLLRLV